MSRLIEADALAAEMYRKSFEVDDGSNVWNSGLWIRYKIFEEAIRDAPTIDAVPVVRCEHCAHKKNCQWYYYSGDDYGFCNWAVKEDNGTEA